MTQNPMQTLGENLERLFRLNPFYAFVATYDPRRPSADQPTEDADVRIDELERKIL